MPMTRRFTVHELRPTPPQRPATPSPSAVAAQPPQTTMPPKTTKPPKPEETGGPSGPEPTRYGDWERRGICVDF